MYSLKTILAFLGFLSLTRAKLGVRVASFTPTSGYVFNNTTIQVTCEATNANNSLNITWHTENADGPLLLNSRTTTITTQTKGDTTSSSLTTTGLRPKRGNTLYIFCKATDSSGNEDDDQAIFNYVKNSDLPRLQVHLPSNHTLPQGENRIRLVCEIHSTNAISSTTVRFLYNNRILQETKVNLETNVRTNSSIFLQCLTQKEMGAYRCVAKGKKYGLVFENSAVTRLQGKFPANVARKQSLNIEHWITMMLFLGYVIY